MTLDEQVRKAHRAKEILDNECYQEIFEGLEQEIIDTWKSSRSAADREEAHRMMQTVTAFKTRLTSMLETGKLASLEINHKKTLLERLTSRE